MFRVRQLLAVLAVVGMTSLAGLIDPSSTYACSCIAPRPVAEYRGNAEYAVLVGRVANVDANQRGSFVVERWFQGGAAPVVPFSTGGGMCGPTVSAGQQLVLVSFVDAGVLQAGVCSPIGDLATAEGQALAQEVAAAFGAGRAADGDPPGAAGVPSGVIVGLGALVLLVGAVMIVARRERA